LAILALCAFCLAALAACGARVQPPEPDRRVGAAVPDAGTGPVEGAAERPGAEAVGSRFPIKNEPTVGEEAGKGWREPVTGMEFVWVPGGCYHMGDVFGDGNQNEIPVHEVCVDGFWMGKYEVTQGPWEKVTGKNPSFFKKGDNYPVERVSW
jgi:formylglycine-generating enzyme required for sulfatase activity